MKFYDVFLNSLPHVYEIRLPRDDTFLLFDVEVGTHGALC